MQRKIKLYSGSISPKSEWVFELLPTITLSTNYLLMDEVKWRDYSLEISWLFWCIGIANHVDEKKELEAIFKR